MRTGSPNRVGFQKKQGGKRVCAAAVVNRTESEDVHWKDGPVMKAAASKPNNLNSVPRTYTRRRELSPASCPSDLHMHAVAYVCTHINNQTNVKNTS